MKSLYEFFSKYKKIIACIIACIVLIFCVWATVSNIVTKSELNRANRTIEELTARLGTVTTGLSAAEFVIGTCRNNVTEISNRLAGNTGKLADIIGNLEVIRDQVELLEECLNSYYSNSGSNNNNIIN